MNTTQFPITCNSGALCYATLFIADTLLFKLGLLAEYPTKFPKIKMPIFPQVDLPKAETPTQAVASSSETQAAESLDLKGKRLHCNFLDQPQPSFTADRVSDILNSY